MGFSRHTKSIININGNPILQSLDILQHRLQDQN
jgi:hypothetical protein